MVRDVFIQVIAQEPAVGRASSRPAMLDKLDLGTMITEPVQLMISAVSTPDGMLSTRYMRMVLPIGFAAHGIEARTKICHEHT